MEADDPQWQPLKGAAKGRFIILLIIIIIIISQQTIIFVNMVILYGLW